MSFDFLSSLINGGFESASQSTIHQAPQISSEISPKRVKRKLLTEPSDQSTSQHIGRRAPPTLRIDPSIDEYSNQSISVKQRDKKSSRKRYRSPSPSNLVENDIEEESTDQPLNQFFNKSVDDSFNPSIDESFNPLLDQPDDQSNEQSDEETESDDELASVIAAIEAARTETTGQATDTDVDPDTPGSRRKRVTRTRMRKKKPRLRRLDFRPITTSSNHSKDQAATPSSKSKKKVKPQSIDYSHLKYRLGYLTNMGRFYRQLRLILGVVRDVSISRSIVRPITHPTSQSSNQSASQLTGGPKYQSFDRSVDVLSALLPIRRVAAEQVFKLFSQTFGQSYNSSPITEMSPHSSQSIGHSTNQSNNQIDEVTRFYRRMRTVRPFNPAINIPNLDARNGPSVLAELSIKLYRCGMVDQAYEEIDRLINHPPHDTDGYLHGLIGTYAYHVARETEEKAQEVEQSASQANDDNSFSQSQSFSFSLSQSVNSNASTNLMNKSKNYRTIALKHFKRARELMPQCDTWLFYETLIHVWQGDGVEEDEEVDSSMHSSSSQPLIEALVQIHQFTNRYPHDVSGWNLKLSFLLNNHASFLQSINHCCQQLVHLDPCNLPAIDVLVQIHESHRCVVTDRLIDYLFRYLDIDAENEHVWSMLHELMHHRLMVTDRYVTEEEAKRSIARIVKQYTSRIKGEDEEDDDDDQSVDQSFDSSLNEPEIEGYLADFAAQDDVTHHVLAQEIQQTINRHVKKEEPDSDHDQSTNHSQSDNNQQSINQSLQISQSMLYQTFEDWSLDDEIQSRLEWWQASRQYFRGMEPRLAKQSDQSTDEPKPKRRGRPRKHPVASEPLSAEIKQPFCDFDTPMSLDHHRSCVYGLMLKSVAHLPVESSSDSDSSVQRRSRDGRHLLQTQVFPH